MTREEKVAELERMLAKVPDVMSPLRASISLTVVKMSYLSAIKWGLSNNPSNLKTER